MAAAGRVATENNYCWAAFVRGTLTMYNVLYEGALLHFTEMIRVKPRDTRGLLSPGRG